MEETYIEEDGQVFKSVPPVPINKETELEMLHLQKISKESFIAEQQSELDIINNKIEQLEDL